MQHIVLENRDAVMTKGIKKFSLGFFVLMLFTMLIAMPLGAYFKAGQKLIYDVTFGNILKGYAEIRFFGTVATITEAETLTVLADSALIGTGIGFLSDSVLIIDADSMVEYFAPDSVGKDTIESLIKNRPIPITVIKNKPHNILYITYDTKFIGNIYNLHADIYADEQFFPLLIETQIMRTGNQSRGKELFFPDRNMAIFSQIIGEKQEIDTLLREHPLQDATTLPFYFSCMENQVGDTLYVSLAQGEYSLSYVDTEIIEYGEGHDFRYYHTYRIESEPEGFKLWIGEKIKIPIQVHLESQKIKMILSKREIDKSSSVRPLSEDEIKQKLSHLFPPD
jgi:hypothetical protein